MNQRIKTIENLSRGSRRGSNGLNVGGVTQPLMCRFLHFLTVYIIKGTTAGHIIGLT